jgi:peptidoglycan/xylan/chitin deacetylase (PgdA/CDA1 family)
MRSLPWPRLKELQDGGWEIGSHTVSHPRLTTLADRELADELTRSRQAVEDALHTPCTSLAYPYGDVDARVVEAARAAGYTAAGALPDRWLHDDPLAFPRAGIYHGDDLRRFRLKVSPTVRRLRRTLKR